MLKKQADGMYPDIGRQDEVLDELKEAVLKFLELWDESDLREEIDLILRGKV